MDLDRFLKLDQHNFPMKRFSQKALWMILIFSFFPATSLAGKNATSDFKRQPKVNFYNNSRNYSRPILKFFQTLGFRASSPFYSRYVWNGLAYSEGPVWQPSAQIEYRGFGASVQGNFVLDDEPNQGQFNEFDFTVYYGRKIKNLELDFSLTYSIYPNDNPASLNFSQDGSSGNLHLAYPIGPIDLFTDLNFFINNPSGGFFWDLGLGYQKNLPLNFALSVSVLFGMSEGQYKREFIGPNLGGFGPNVFTFSLAFPVSPVKGLILTPQFNVSTLLTDALRNAVVYPTNVWGDLEISYNF